jgi:hypothetical protein
LKAESSKWSANENNIIKNTNSIAEKMTQLSKNYKEDRSSSMKRMIELGREINEDCKSLLIYIKSISDTCTDKVLKGQLLAAMNTIPTISTQLKILTAVKAAEPKDLDSEKQLILCCKNLMNHMKLAIKSSEVASIRSLSTDTVKFRRAIYRKPTKALIFDKV